MAFAFPSGLNPDLFPLAWLIGEWEGEGQIAYHEQIPTARAWNHITFSHDGGTYLKYESVIRILGEGEAELPGPTLPSEGIGSPEAQALLRKQPEGERAAQPYEIPGEVAEPADDNAEQPNEGAGEGGGEPDGAIVGADAASTGEAAGATDTAEPADGGTVADDAEAGARDPETDAGDAGADKAPHEAQIWSTETGFWRVNPLPHNSAKGNEFYLDVFIVDAGGRMTYFNGEATPARVTLVSAKTVRAAFAAEVDGSKRMYGFVNDHLAWAEDIVAFGHELSSYGSFFLTRTKDGDGNPV